MCYNRIMKNFVKILITLSLLFSAANAASFDVLVLPSDLLETKENSYGFEEPSIIFANDIIKNFNSTNGKVKSPNLYDVKNQLSQNTQLKQISQTALKTFKASNKIDYKTYKTLGNEFSCKSVLLITASVTTNKNSLKRGIWEVLEISSGFDISYPYRLETAVVLLDTVNDIVMWSNSYSTKLGDNSNCFSAKSLIQAKEEYEKIKLYSKNVLALSASQNMMLRFFPKTIRPVKRDVEETSGGALRFERTLPEKPKEYNLKPRENFYGDMIYGI